MLEVRLTRLPLERRVRWLRSNLPIVRSERWWTLPRERSCATKGTRGVRAPVVTRRLIAECVCADDPPMAQAEAAIVRAASVISQVQAELRQLRRQRANSRCRIVPLLI
jgi:hypothetical protein